MRSIWLDGEVHAEACSLRRWDYLGEVRVLAADAVPTDLAGVADGRFPVNFKSSRAECCVRV